MSEARPPTPAQIEKARLLAYNAAATSDNGIPTEAAVMQIAEALQERWVMGYYERERLIPPAPVAVGGWGGDDDPEPRIFGR